MEGKFKMRLKEEEEPVTLREGREAFLAKEAAGPKASGGREFGMF